MWDVPRIYIYIVSYTPRDLLGGMYSIYSLISCFFEYVLCWKIPINTRSDATPFGFGCQLPATSYSKTHKESLGTFTTGQSVFFSIVTFPEMLGMSGS